MTAPLTANSAIRSGIMTLGATRWKNAYPKASALRDQMVSASDRLAGLAAGVDDFTEPVATFLQHCPAAAAHLEAGETFSQGNLRSK